MSLLLAPPASGAGLCSVALEKLQAIFTSEAPYQSLIEPANELARNVLGELFPKTDLPEVKSVECLAQNGCSYSPSLHVIQMIGPFKEGAKSAFGPIYIHELAHSIQNQFDPDVATLRREIGVAGRQKYLKVSAKINKAKNNIEREYAKGATLRGLWYFFSNAEAKVREREQRLLDEILPISEKIARENGEANETDGAEERVNFLKDCSGELFADLVTCSAYSDGDVVANALSKVYHREMASRRNSQISEPPRSGKVNHVWMDVHDTLQFARTTIWFRYLKGKSNAEIRKTLAILEKATRAWPKTAADLLEESSPDQFLVDVEELNSSFLEYFEQLHRK